MTNPYPPGAPNWVDLGTTDVAGAVAFYRELFGWTHEDFGPEMGGYGVFRNGGRQVAGIGPATDPSRGTSWSTYLATADVDATAAAVLANGGTVVDPPSDVTDKGRIALFTDPAGQFFNVWQAGTFPGAELVDEPGSLTWSELLSGDVDAARVFYPAVFGVGAREVDLGGGMTYTLFEAGGRAVAGAMQVAEPQPAQWSVYFAVADARSTTARAVELGATAVVGPMDSPPGTFAILNDPQGGTFCILQNNPEFTI
jgi:hypothetical protein